jgi:hypothetical protein
MQYFVGTKVFHYNPIFAVLHSKSDNSILKRFSLATDTFNSSP